MKPVSLIALSTLLLTACSSAAPATGVDVSTGKTILTEAPAEDASTSAAPASIDVLPAEETPAELVAIEAPAQASPDRPVARSSSAAASTRATSPAPATSPAQPAQPEPEPEPEAEPEAEETPAPAIEPRLLAAAAAAARDALAIVDRTIAPTPSATPEPAATTPEEPEAREPATTAEVYSAVEQLPGLRGWTVIPFAHFTRGDRHAVIAWPAMNSSGQLRDATVVGICLEENAAGELEECGRRWVVQGRASSRSALIAALGGSDYSAAGRGSGAALDDLGPALSRRGNEFAQAARSRNGNAARRAALAFARLLPLDRVAYDNDVAELLYLAATQNGTLEHVSTTRSGDTATLTFHVMLGPFRMQTITATARPVTTGSERWIVVSYR